MLNNQEIEQQVIAAAIVDEAAYEDAADVISAGDFFYPVHAVMWEWVQGAYNAGKRPDVITLSEAVTDAPEGYVNDVVDSLVSAYGNGERARLVHEIATRRKLQDIAHRIIEQCDKPDPTMTAQDRIETAEGMFSSLVAHAESGPVEIDTALDEACAMYDRILAGDYAGMPTRISALDTRLGGLFPGSLYIVAGRPGMGKTALGLTIAYNAMYDGKKSLFFSLEMPRAELTQRLLARMTEVSISQQRSRDLKKEQAYALKTNADKLRKKPLYIDDTSALTVSQICARAKRHKRRYGLDVVVVDYLGLITSEDKRAQMVHQVAEISKRLKQLAKELNVPVVLLSQLNRGVEQRDNKRPMLSDLRDSGAIEQDADVVIFCYRDEYYLEKDEPKKKHTDTEEKYSSRLADWHSELDKQRGKAELIIAKFRQGETGTAYVGFNGVRQLFHDLGE